MAPSTALNIRCECLIFAEVLHSLCYSSHSLPSLPSHSPGSLFSFLISLLFSLLLCLSLVSIPPSTFFISSQYRLDSAIASSFSKVTLISYYLAIDSLLSRRSDRLQNEPPRRLEFVWIHGGHTEKDAFSPESVVSQGPVSHVNQAPRGCHHGVPAIQNQIK